MSFALQSVSVTMPSQVSRRIALIVLCSTDFFGDQARRSLADCSL
jgi:hypothetical protein